MIAGSLAKRYARALIELARDAGQLEAVMQDLERFGAVVESSKELKIMATSQDISRAKRTNVMREVVNAMQISGLTQQFVLLLASKNRLMAFGDILRVYRELYDEHKGIVRVAVESAAPLSPALQEKLTSMVEKTTGKRVMLSSTVDPSLIGGMRTRVDDLLFDGSLSSQLKRIKSSLLNEKLS